MKINLLNFMHAVVDSPVALLQPVALVRGHCVHSCCQQTCEGDPRVECEPTACSGMDRELIQLHESTLFTSKGNRLRPS